MKEGTYAKILPFSIVLVLSGDWGERGKLGKTVPVEEELVE